MPGTDVSSIYSQPMTRESSYAGTVSTLPTPLDDDLPPPRPSKPTMLGPRSMNPVVRYEGSMVVLREHQGELGDDTSYFSRPAVQRQKSTKMLISRYESMNASVSAVPQVDSRPPLVRMTKQVKPESTFVAKKDKGNSPLRRSFQNFLSVFKGKKGSTKEYSSSQSLPVPTTVPNVQPYSARGDPPLRTGSVLYLSHIESTISSPVPTPNSPILPVWTTCTASLHPSHILATSLSSYGNPSTHTVILSDCTDVRSLALTEIDAQERALLPSKGDDYELKVFELIFEGRRRERFAVGGVQERAGWVSAIWDAILKAQENKGTPNFETAGALNVTHNTSTDMSIPRTPTPTPRTLERALPPIPKDTSSTPLQPSHSSAHTHFRVALYDPPHPSSTRSPASLHHTPSATTCTPPGSRSPSIRTLGARSVVKQRLAQIERSQSVASSTHERVSSLRRLQGRKQEGEAGRAPSVSTRSERLRTAFLNIEQLHRQSSFSTDRGCSGRVQSLEFNHSPEARNAENVDATPPSPPSRYTTPAPHSAHPPNTDNTDLENHILSLKVAVQNLPNELRPLVGATDGNGNDHQAGVFDALEIIAEGIDGVEGRVETSGVEIMAMREMLEATVETVGLRAREEPSVVERLRDIQSQLDERLPDILRRLEGRHPDPSSNSEAKAPEIMVMRNLKPSSQSKDEPTTGEAAQLSDVCVKLDGLVELLHGTVNTAEEVNPSEGLVDKLKATVTHLENNSEKWKTQEAQQMDTIRYLNELNSWLESFVNNGTSQIQAMASGVQQICQEFGCAPPVEAQSITPAPDGQPGGISLLAGVRQLLLENKGRDQSAAELKDSVHGLIGAIHENLKQNAETRTALTTDAMNGLIARQREDQGGMLRALAVELSNDIRGERLRFVEAMKEATAINVQAHVEQFKKELTREVLLMTQEVGRLHREKQVMEQQIADLFSFYSKQKQSGPTNIPRAGGLPQLPPQAQAQAYDFPQASATQRPLPYPFHQ